MSAQHRELCRVQAELEKLYELEAAPPIAEFVDIQAAYESEQLLVYEDSDALLLELRLPERGEVAPSLTNGYLELVEGVSHFLLVVERARTGLPTTLLELELQAEVDKFALLTLGTNALVANQNDGERAMAAGSGARTRHAIHQWLFEDATFLHPADSQAGDRYRAANRLAARYWSRLLESGEDRALDELRRFYRAGPHEKIRLAKAV